jgi:gamma-glutamyltranspeptidase/glutathione hydrolase
VKVAFGIMGGWNQAQAHAQFISNMRRHRMNIQAALEAARVTKISFTGRDVIVESRCPEFARASPRRVTRSMCREPSRAWSAEARA